MYMGSLQQDDSTVFESNFPAMPQGSGLVSTPPAGTILGMPIKTVLIGAVLLALLYYAMNHKGD